MLSVPVYSRFANEEDVAPPSQITGEGVVETILTSGFNVSQTTSPNSYLI